MKSARKRGKTQASDHIKEETRTHTCGVLIRPEEQNLPLAVHVILDLGVWQQQQVQHGVDVLGERHLGLNQPAGDRHIVSRGKD